MLSAETAMGKYPVKTVEAMTRICLETEKQKSVRKSKHRVDTQFTRVDEAIAMSAMYLANHTNIKGLIALTQSGAA
jgi:pyruvate kinase